MKLTKLGPTEHKIKDNSSDEKKDDTDPELKEDNETNDVNIEVNGKPVQDETLAPKENEAE